MCMIKTELGIKCIKKKMLCHIIIIITIVNVTYKLICQMIMSDHRKENNIKGTRLPN
jgi:hypothetical protein